jgi:hypothetical protein
VNAPGAATTYQDPGTRGPASGIGIESQDIVNMTDRMMRDLLTNPTLTARTPAARVIIDAGRRAAHLLRTGEKGAGS